MLLNPFDDEASRFKTKAATIYAFLVAANLAAWAWAWVTFRDQPALLGTALLAYMFGLRHAFDADHIAAIDNVVRKLMQEEKAPCSVGFFFSLGHSTIVALAAIVIALTASAMQSRLDRFHSIGGVISTSASAISLLVIGLANLFILRGIWAAFNRARRGEPIADADLNADAFGGGPIGRLFRPLFRVISRSWQMYPVGFLFGLGFDTATEIGLLSMSANQAAQGMSLSTILVFPALFAAGMSLMDTTDSILMTGAYGWAFVHPIRKLWYNLTITAASVVVALFVGGIEALALIGDKLDFRGGVWDLVGDINANLANFGYAVVGIFVLSWAASTVIYRIKRYDELAAGPS